MKKTCDRCRALRMGQGVPPSCDLGYKQERGVPQEECPKPLSILKFLELGRERGPFRSSTSKAIIDPGPTTAPGAQEAAEAA